jgi:hypothetical protein
MWMWLVDGGCDDEVDQKRSVLMLLLLLLCMLWHVFVFWFRAASLKLLGGNYLSHRPRLSHTMSSLGKAAGSAAVRGIERCSAATFSQSRITSVMDSNTVAQRSPFTSNSRDNGDDDNEVAPDDHHFGVWPPNQTTVIFQRMQVTCPDVIKAYSSCVVNKQNSGALIQGACDEQFRAVMDCFRSVR